MPSRNFHNKNRHGCTACKAGKKKCDEQRPKCGRCTRLRTQCTFDQAILQTARRPTPHPVPLVQPVGTAWSALDPLVQEILLLNIPNIDLSDVEVIHHAKFNDVPTFDTLPGLRPVRQLDFKAKAPESPYLLYGTLAASALYLHTQSVTTSPQSRSYREKSISHFQLALASYRSHLSTIDERTCHSIFAFSVILAGLGFGLQRPSSTEQDLDATARLDGIISTFDLLLGAVAVAKESTEWVEESAREPLLLPIRQSLHSVDGRVPVEADAILSSLPLRLQAAERSTRSTETTSVHPDTGVIYESALAELLNAYRCIGRAGPENVLGVFGWPAFVDKSYLQILKNRNNAALVILAHYGVALHALDHIWWLNGIGSALVNSVVAQVAASAGVEWRELLQWPIEQVEQQFTATVPMENSLFIVPIVNEYALHASYPFEAALAITQTEGIREPLFRNPQQLVS